MPTPVGHSLAGYAIARAGFRDCAPIPPRVVAFGACLLACLPDIDLAVGFLLGDARRFHHGPPTSLAFALAVALATSLIPRRLDGYRLRVFVVAFACVASHGLLDMLRTADGSRAGVQYLWPLSHRFYSLPWHILNHAPELDRVPPATAARLLLRNVIAEILVIGPFAALSIAAANRHCRFHSATRNGIDASTAGRGKP